MGPAAAVGGTCKWFDSTKGFGFLIPADGSPDIFVHRADLQWGTSSSECQATLAAGECVEYIPVTDAKTGRPRATQVTAPGGGHVQGLTPGGTPPLPRPPPPPPRKGPGTKRGRDAFEHGNYVGYYRKRCGQTLLRPEGDKGVSGETPSETSTSRVLPGDARLDVLCSFAEQHGWVRDRVVLDVGCNEGVVSLHLGLPRFGAARVHGVDIDPGLIERAHANRRKVRDRLNRAVEDVVKFHVHDYSSRDGGNAGPRGPYGAILALSVSKWIHLNGGDAGLRRFFARLVGELLPGGILVLEPQRWGSYGRNKRSSTRARANFGSLTLRPEGFVDLLEREYGMRHEMTLKPTLVDGAPAGWDRPIHVLRKEASDGTEHP